MADKAQTGSIARRIVRRRWVQLIVAVVAVLVVAGLLPPVQVRIAAGTALAEALGADFPRPLAAPVERRATALGGVSGHLYTPDNPAPAVMVVPGATPRGKNDPLVVRLARALTRSDRVVFVPDLRLYQFDVDTDDIDRIVRATRALPTLDAVAADPDVVLLGASFGGSYALIAAADPRIRHNIAMVATVGSYFDIIGLIQALSTGVSIVDGQRRTWHPSPDTRRVLPELALELVRPSQRSVLKATLRGKADPNQLPPRARTVHALVTNSEPARTYRLASRLPPRAREALAELSPAHFYKGITAPVVAMHARDDPIVPHAELIRLRRHMPQATTFAISSFRHVEFVADDPRRLAGDLVRLWRYAVLVYTAPD